MRSLLLVEALIAGAILSALLASIGVYCQRVQVGRGLAEQKCAQGLSRAELKGKLDRVFHSVLTPRLQPGASRGKSTCSFWLDEQNSALHFTYKPPFEKMWTLGVVAEGRLRCDDEGGLLLDSTPVDLGVSGERFQKRASLLATGVCALSFKFLHIEQGAPSLPSRTAFERCTWPLHLGYLPTMLKVRVEFKSGAVWQSAHFLQTSSSILYP